MEQLKTLKYLLKVKRERINLTKNQVEHHQLHSNDPLQNHETKIIKLARLTAIKSKKHLTVTVCKRTKPSLRKTRIRNKSY